MKAEKRRCGWAGADPLYVDYHDREWGRPVHLDTTHFEFLVLEGAQAGLSWITILRKRDAYRRAYDGFDPEIVATYGKKKIAALLADEGIVRNKLKVTSSIENARVFLDLRREHGSFDAYVWSFVGGKPIKRRPKTLSDVPATSPESDAMSKALKKRGMRFVGSTICYSYLQACGLIDDHVSDCFRAAK
jgi:DNA-3-methyladenine glycosylase I